MAHAQKQDFVFRRNGRVHLNRRGASVQSTAGSRGVRISGSNAGYTMFRGIVKCTGYQLHLPVSPSLPLPCVAMCHHISTGLYCTLTDTDKWSYRLRTSFHAKTFERFTLVLVILTLCNMAVVLKLFLSPALFLVTQYPLLQWIMAH